MLIYRSFLLIFLAIISACSTSLPKSHVIDLGNQEYEIDIEGNHLSDLGDVRDQFYRSSFRTCLQKHNSGFRVMADQAGILAGFPSGMVTTYPYSYPYIYGYTTSFPMSTDYPYTMGRIRCEGSINEALRAQVEMPPKA